VLDQFAFTFNSILQLADQYTQAQIAQEQAIIDARQGRIDELRGQLSEEQALKEQGLANDVANLEQRISKEQQLLESAQQRQLELQEKAARRQLAINALQQASEIGLAIAKLSSQNIGFGPAALIIIPALIAGLLSAIAAGKQQAQQLSQPPTFPF